MNELMLPIMLVALASVFEGTFGLGMKYIKPLAWEAWWIIHVTVAMAIFPLTWALLVVPDLWQVIAQAPTNELIIGAVLGVLWGIGGILFGISVGYIGMSLTYGMVMGIGSIVGALIPFILRFNTINSSSIPFILSALILLTIAVYIITSAGLKRDKQLANGGAKITGIKKGKAFRNGLIIAAISGVLSAMLAVGFDNTEAIGKLAEESGALQRNTSLARWIILLAGAYAMNFGYALFLLIKNNSFATFKSPGMIGSLKWSVIAGLLWFAALGIYGQGVALMGNTGTIVCWPLMLGLALIVSNITAIATGEWQGARGPLKLVGLGVFIIIVATVLMAYASTLKT